MWYKKMNNTAKNKSLLQALQNQAYEKEIHALKMIVKPIPDSDKKSGLDPRVEQTFYENSLKPNPLNECVEVPVELIRMNMGYPNKDVTTIPILTTEIQIQSRNGNVKIRVYTPKSNKLKPCITYFHGGAFIGGSLKAVENYCKILSELAEAVVVNVDYRLAPEHPFPAGLYDCFDTVKWIYDNADKLEINQEWITVAGDSAGGNLAAVCCMLDRDFKMHMIHLQVLIYPAVLIDSFPVGDYKWKLKEYDISENDEFAMNAVLSLKALTAGMPELYMGQDSHVTEPYAAPLCSDSLAGLPEALIITSEYDFLRLQIEAYSRKLIRDGVGCRHIMYCGMDHAFIDKIGVYPQAYDSAVEISKEMKKRFY